MEAPYLTTVALWKCLLFEPRGFWKHCSRRYTASGGITVCEYVSFCFEEKGTAVMSNGVWLFLFNGACTFERARQHGRGRRCGGACFGHILKWTH